MKKKLQKNRVWLILGLILLIAAFFRFYKLDIFFIFEHDQDLLSWIVKDIWIERHLRLIGQLTSIEGVFIGPLFYYLAVPFYVTFGMNPISAAYLASIIGLLTVLSIYFVFQRFFGKVVGLFGALIYATSLGPVFFDKWAVPTQPTMLWCIWFLFAVFNLAEGKTKSLIIASILIGLIWHIHIALLPLIPLFIFAFFLKKQKITPKIAVASLAALVFLTLPFWLFEIKQNFLQTKSLIFSKGGAGEILVGWERLLKILDATGIIFRDAFFKGWEIPKYLVLGASIFLFIFSIYKKLLTKKQILLIVSWIALVFLVQMITKNPISEYYVSNLTIIPILLASLMLGFLYHQKSLRYFAIGLVLAYTLFNTFLLLTKPEDWHHYKFREQTAEYIRQDAQKNNYECISHTFINSRLGTGVGFRYLLWWKGVDLVRRESGVPLYTIVIPYDAVPKEQLSAQFKYFGVINPERKNYDFSTCKDPQYEMIPLLGFTN